MPFEGIQTTRPRELATDTAIVPDGPRRKHALNRWLGRLGWLVSATAALALSTWSLYVVGRSFGIPPILAGLIGVSFDGAALVLADLSLRAARLMGSSALGDRFLMILMAGTSASVNAYHGVLSHDPAIARLLFAAPPIVALSLFERHTRFERRAAMRRAGRVAEPMPVFGALSWLLIPLRTFKAVHKILVLRVERIAHGQEPDNTFSIMDNESKRARLWAKDQGIAVNESGRLSGEVLSAYRAAVAAASNGHLELEQ